MPRYHKHSVVKLETMSRSNVCCIAVLFLTTFLTFCFVGYRFGPEQYVERTISDEKVTKHDLFWTMKLRSMTEKHRNLDVSAHFRAKALKLHFPLLKNTVFWMDERIEADVTVSVCGLSEHQVYHDGFKINPGYKHDRFFDDPHGTQCMGTWLLRNFTTPMRIRCRGGFATGASAATANSAKGTVPTLKDSKAGVLTGEEWCHGTHFLHFNEVQYAGYDVIANFDSKAFGSNVDEVKFSVRYGNIAETYYLMAYKYCFVGLSAIAYCLYTMALSKLSSDQRSVEQYMLHWLSALLVLFNDPFYALEMWKASQVLGILSVLFQTTFMAALLLFWLILVDHIRVEAMDARIVRKKFYPAKLAFVGIFWLASSVVECYNLEERRDNPAYNIRIQWHSFAFFRVVAIAAIVVYVLWMALMICVLCTEIRSLNRRFQFLLLFSAAMAVITVGGTIAGHLGHWSHNMAELTGYYSLFNLYVFTLTFLYSPSKEPVAAYGSVSMSAEPTSRAGYAHATSAAVSQHSFDFDDDGDTDGASAIEMTGV